MEVMGERKEFCNGKSAPGGSKPLNCRVIGKVHEKNYAFERTGFFKIPHEEGCLLVGDPHRDKYHCKVFSFTKNLCLPCDLGGKLVCRQPGTGEDRELLTSDKGR